MTFHLRAAATALALAFAPEALADPAPATATAQPTLEAIAIDGLRACMSIAEGRAPADAANIFGFAPDADKAGFFFHETDKGKVDFQPPAPDRRSCRVSISALTLDNQAVIDTLQEFLTTPPQAYAPLQSRIAESIGDGFAARTSIWASSDGKVLNQVTLYEILANEYYHGPMILIDHLVDRR